MFMFLFFMQNYKAKLVYYTVLHLAPFQSILFKTTLVHKLFNFYLFAYLDGYCKEKLYIVHGSITYSDNPIKVGTKIAYHCQTGYRLEGAAERRCLKSGFWSGRKSSCTS